MSGLFMPKGQKSLGELIKPKNEYGREYLFGACQGWVLIMDYVEGHGISILKRFKRESNITGLTIHRGEIVECDTDGYIRDALTGEVIRKRKESLFCVSSVDGVLYDCDCEGQIRRTKSGGVISKRDNWVWDLYSHEGIVYDCGDHGKVFKTATDTEVCDYNCRLFTLITHDDGELYVGGNPDGNIGVFSGVVRGLNKDCAYASCFFNHEGKGFYMDPDGKVFDFETNFAVADLDEGCGKIISVPGSIAEAFL